MNAGRAREEVSAGGIVVRHDDGAHCVLLIRDSYRNWGFPKGHVEPGEAPPDAALREVAEETGLSGLTGREYPEVVQAVSCKPPSGQLQSAVILSQAMAISSLDRRSPRLP